MNRPDMTSIYKEYRTKVMGYIYNHVQSTADAEDLCSDVFEKVQLKLDSYDSEKAALSTWIYSITRNCVIDFYRRSRQFSELDEEMPDESSIDEDLLNNETLNELAEALASLPSQLREIIVLKYYDGKPLTEIGEMLHLSYGSIKLKHAKALDLLRKKMDLNGPLK